MDSFPPRVFPQRPAYGFFRAQEVSRKFHGLPFKKAASASALRSERAARQSPRKGCARLQFRGLHALACHAGSATQLGHRLTKRECMLWLPIHCLNRVAGDIRDGKWLDVLLSFSCVCFGLLAKFKRQKHALPCRNLCKPVCGLHLFLHSKECCWPRIAGSHLSGKRDVLCKRHTHGSAKLARNPHEKFANRSTKFSFCVAVRKNNGQTQAEPPEHWRS